ncbi:TBCEL_2 [Blepharisma stoltei]|uniref:Ubiquitin-like domain-containing protein n=1 Tax=Blepharisma stoltei TaxID=1481888 RepID=A0AAU9JS24_9CILI|nr:unnamed protein product [Blepharisma stoltei]
MSFVALVRDRYVNSYNKPNISGVQIKVNRIPTLEELTVVSLKNSNLSSSGPEGEISMTCPNIKELDISETCITNWQELINICKQLNALEFIDIGRLRLDPQSFADSDSVFEKLKWLVMNRVNLGYQEMRIMSKTFPNIETLVLRASRIDFIEVFRDCFQNVTRLNLGKCDIREFSQIEALSVMENLQELKLYNNPIAEIINVSHLDGFKKLKRLNLSFTQIRDLQSIYNLNSFPVLTELRINDSTFSERFKEHARKILINYLQNIEEINGSKVSVKERTTAERQFLRDFSDPADISRHVMQPTKETLFEWLIPEEIPTNIQVFDKVHSKHGNVLKFAEVNLAPPTEALVHIRLEEGESQDHVVSLSWKVRDLKTLCERIYGIPKSEQKLFYGDHEVMEHLGFDLLRFDNQNLSALNLKDNDVILVRRKD